MKITFNLIACTGFLRERDCGYELRNIARLLGFKIKSVAYTGFSGLLIALIDGDPHDFVLQLKKAYDEGKVKIRFILKIVPIDIVVNTNENEIIKSSIELAKSRIEEGETYKIVVRARGATLDKRKIIDVVAKNIDRKVNLTNPDKIVQIEIFPLRTGIAVLRPNEIFSLYKISRKV